MGPTVFIQPVHVAIDLGRSLRPGDALVVEARQDVREGELLVAETEEGAVVGRYTATGPHLLVVSLDAPGEPRRVSRNSLRLRGVVIGLRSAL
jgi:SOS-response transcriptional repressor LexA